MASSPPARGQERPAAGIAAGVESLRQAVAAEERHAADNQDRAASATAAHLAALLSVRSGFQRNLSRQEELTRLKHQLGELEADFTKYLSVKLTNESKRELIKGSISSMTAINEQLKNSVADKRSKRDQYAAAVSNQLKAVEALEAKDSEYGKTWSKDTQEHIIWYHKFLGFQVVGGEGVKFVFDKVNSQDPEMECSFSLKRDKDRYTLLQCDPLVKDSEELMKDLNLTNDLFEFVRKMRQRFQAATTNAVLPVSSLVSPDASSLPASSPVVTSDDARNADVGDQSHPERVLPVSQAVSPDASYVPASYPVIKSVDARNENVADQSHSERVLPVSQVVSSDASSVQVSSPVVTSVGTRSKNVADQSHSRSKNKKQDLPTKRKAAISPGSIRCSPRFVERRGKP